jgi:GNAT superfamily N-acetyltransferase
MDIVYKPITITSNHAMMDTLVHEYFRDTIAKENLPPLDINWDTYVDLERNNHTLVVGAWDHDELVGFVMYIVMEAPHHRRINLALCDILAVLPAYRGRHVGRILVASAEHLLRDRGVHYVHHQYRVEYGVTPLFEKLGFEVIERTYRKELL